MNNGYPWYSVCASLMFAALAGCGGGGGGGSDGDSSNGGGSGSGSTSLSGQEQAAVAGFASTDSASTAETGMSQADGAGTSSSTSSTSGFTTQQTAEKVTCDSGEAYNYQDQGGDFALNQIDFPDSRFQADPSSTGNDSELRADECRTEASSVTTTIDGFVDTADIAFGGGKDISHVVSGGLDGSLSDTQDVEPPVEVSDRDLTNAFTTTTDLSPDFSLRGKIWSCSGCVNVTNTDFTKDLSNVQGNAALDIGVAARFEFSSGDITFELGDVDQPGTRWEFASRPDKSTSGNSNDAEFVIEGRYAVTDSSDSSCNFDVTYSTEDPLYSPDFLNNAAPTKGEVKVTVNSGSNAGTDYTVNFDTGSQDTIEVDGQEFSKNDFSCTTSPNSSS